jgi:hypothetical protein
MNSVPQIQNNDFDDGFSAPYRLRGVVARWNDQKGWHDGDGLPLPSPMLVVGVDTLLLRWHPQREEIRAKPLPDPALLNGAIPASEWRTGLSTKRFRSPGRCAGPEWSRWSRWTSARCRRISA